MKKKIKIKPIIITLVILGIIGTAGYSFISKANAKPTIEVDFTEIKKSELVDSINLKGVVESETSTNIYSNLASKISTVPVSVGDKVTAGQVLLTLDDTDAKLNLKERSEQLSETAQANLNQLQNNQRIYNEAVNNLNSGVDAQVLTAKSRVTTAKNSLDIAQKNYDDKIKENNNKENINLINAESTVETTRIDLENKKDDLEKNKLLFEAGAVSQYEIDNLEESIANIQRKYDDTVANVNSIKNSMDKELKQLSDNLKTAQINYDDAIKNENSASISASQNIKKYESAVKGSEIAVNTDSGSVAVQKLQKQINDSIVKASTSGTVTAVFAKIGAPGNGLMFVIEDTEKLSITTKFKEYDASKVKEGLDVIIKSDATGEKSYFGKVSKIAPTSVKNNLGESASTSDVEFEAEVAVTSANTDLKIGMNTRLELILNKKENVFYVPYDAIGKNDNGEDVVYVAVKNEEVANKDLGAKIIKSQDPKKAKPETYKAVQKKVELGLETDFNVEISSNELTEGMKIISDATEMSDGLEIILN